MTRALQTLDSKSIDIETTSETESPECACGSCHNDGEQHTLMLAADMEGMLADWGEVAFCSMKCVDEFTDTLPLRGNRMRVFVDTVYVVTVELDGREVIKNRRITVAERLIGDHVQELYDEYSNQGWTLSFNVTTLDKL